jgi:hypothetical protein
MDIPMFTCDICGAAMEAEAVLGHMQTHVAREIEVPDIVGEILGWRAWRVDVLSLDGKDVRLRSVTTRTRWPIDDWLYASCGIRPHKAEKVPSKTCSCGIYAAKDRPHLTGMHYHVYSIDDTVVIGQVALAGKVIPGTQGWRAAKARPVKILVPYTRWRLAAGIKNSYGVEVELDNTLKEQLETEEEDD